MTESPFWNDDWMTLQRRYWDQWSRFQQQAMGLKSAATNPWQSALDHWWEAVGTSLPDVGRDFMQKVLDQGKDFFRLAESFSQQLNGLDEQGWKQMADNLAETFSRTFGMAGEGLDSTGGFWEMPLDNWNRMVSALSPVPGDLLRGMPTTGFKENLDRILGAPGLGYARESQAQYQSLYQSVTEYQEALAEYSLFFSRMGEGAAVRLGTRLEGEPASSGRALYDAWIHCCEDEYGDQVMTPEYAKLHGRLVNALMQVKHRWGELLNEYLSAMNIPTQDDLRTMQGRIQEHRRELRAMRCELNELRKQVPATNRPAASDEAPRRPPAAAAPVKKRAVTRKPSAAKKKAVAKKAK